jgi:hypothetical protein
MRYTSPAVNRTALRRLCFAALLLFARGCAVAGLAALHARWDKPVLGACFFGGDELASKRVKSLFAQWTSGVGLQVEFAGGAVRAHCRPDAREDIRIAFQRGHGNWSALGQQNIAQAGQPTMNLDLADPTSPSATHEILREIGHALGLLHQEQNPAYACRGELRGSSNRNSPWAEVSRPVVPDDGRYLVSGFDRGSVMRIFAAPEHFARGTDSPCYGPPSAELSADDRDLIAKMYPPRPRDVSSERVHQSVSIVLDGGLSQENYQYLVPALRKAGLIGMRQYVDIAGLPLSEILVKEGLSPTAAVAKDFERFLCDENPHICTRRGGSTPVWSNQSAKANTPVETGECGSRALAKSIVCLPNVRMQTQRVFVDSRIDPSKTTLADHVLNVTRGCDDWNDSCRSLVELSNPKLDKRLLLTRLKGGSMQDVTLPARIYRVPVEFGSDEERKRIDHAVQDVKQTRSRQLGVKPDDIAIRIVAPIGNPVTQQAANLLSEPVRSYADVLLAMNYPFKDEESMREFARYRDVPVAVWDRRVDVTHCELVRSVRQLVYVTPYVPTHEIEPAPQAADECAKPRADNARTAEWWDHGTHIAGILAAQINGKGIGGINPKITLWSWELANGNQFNRDQDPFYDPMERHGIDPKIVNISQTFPRGSDSATTALEEILFGAGQRAGTHNKRLIVAAAGVDRDGQGANGKRIEESYNCRLVPACWSQTQPGRKPRNLISVVALDAKGEKVLKSGDRYQSNFGDVFDVAAVGVATSTLHGNWIGTMAGSSFAAPYVTGLASMIEGKARWLDRDARPSEIKERILFTADRDTPELKESSQFGRINFARALDFTNTMVLLKPATGCGGACLVKGGMAPAGGTILRLQFLPHPSAELVSKHILLQDVRRIIVEPNNVAVYFMEEGRVRAIQGVEFNDPSLEIVVAGRRIALPMIQDFTAASFTR